MQVDCAFLFALSYGVKLGVYLSLAWLVYDG